MAKASKDELAAAQPVRTGRVRRAVERAHLWVCLHGRWLCKLCLAATFSEARLQRRCTEVCPGESAALGHALRGDDGHLLMVADVDGGPCTFCAAFGARCTAQPKELRSLCQGRKGSTTAGLAALVKFRSGLVPDCGGKCGRRVHAVEALHRGAMAHWASVPLPDRCCRMLCQGPSQVRTRSVKSESPERDGIPPPRRAASADRSREFLASLGDDPLDRLSAAAITRRHGRNENRM